MFALMVLWSLLDGSVWVVGVHLERFTRRAHDVSVEIHFKVVKWVQKESPRCRREKG